MELGRLKITDLLKEKNLWQIYLATRKLPDSKFNWSVCILFIVIGALYVFIEPNSQSIHFLILKLADLGFNAAISLLGFLIAGFTIFASLAKPDLLLLMLKHRHKKSGLSYLKYNFFTLLRTFIYLLVFSIFQLCVITLGQENGVIGAFAKFLPNEVYVLSFGTRVVLIVSFGLWALAMTQLKSFVFNVHHFVFTMIKFDAVNHNDRIDEESQSGQ